MTPGKVYYGSKLISSGGADYQRSPDWISMPTINSTEQKVAILMLVGNHNSNFVAFRCSGAYTVDWGDGSIENVATNTTAQHNYVFTNLSASTEFGPIGSKSRQAIIVITPQAGQNLTSISFNFRHSSLTSVYYPWIVEILLSAPLCTSLVFTGSTASLRALEICNILSHAQTSMSGRFDSLTSLRSVSINCTNVTDMYQAFINCYSLTDANLTSTSNVTNWYQSFFTCVSLKNIVGLNTLSSTSMVGTFQNCSSLCQIPAMSLSNSTSFTNTFNGCTSLKRVQATGISKTISFQNCNLGSTELNEIYTNLVDLTGFPGQTITVTGNYGTTSDNPTIATAKNWTVTG